MSRSVKLSQSGKDRWLQAKGKSCKQWMNSHCGRYSTRLLFAFFVLVVLTVIGTIFLMYNEDQDFILAFYWVSLTKRNFNSCYSWLAATNSFQAVVTCSSVGYGDVSVEKSSTRAFLIVYFFIGVGGYAFALGELALIMTQYERDMAIQKLQKKGVTMKMIKEISDDDDGTVTEQELLEYMLEKMDFCARDDIAMIKDMFRQLDVDGSGQISIEDIHHGRHGRQGKTVSKMWMGNHLMI